jgi:predicted metal-binding protein
MNKIESDLEKLRSRAIELGANQAKVIQSSKVVIDPRVRLKCSVPLCDSYGRNRMCPPNIIPVEEFAKALSRYRFGLLIQFEMESGEADIRKKFKGKPLEALLLDSGYVDKMTEGMRGMSLALGKLEKEALYMGYRFAVALSGGCCSLCDECVGPDPKAKCRHPFQARPSIEAVGIDVVATAEAAGLKVEFPAKAKAVWTGLLLVD